MTAPGPAPDRDRRAQAVRLGFYEERGRRKERVEWGVRHAAGDLFHRRGEVDIRVDEAAARRVLSDEFAYSWKHCRAGGCEVVSRTIVTYTPSWEAS